MATENCQNRLSRWIKYLTLISASSLSTGCGQRMECNDFPSSLNSPKTPLYSMRSGKIDEELMLSDNYIKKCYRSSSFSEEGRYPILETVKISDNGNRFLIYEIYGINDLRIAFETNGDGKIVNAYQFSAL